MSEQKMKRVSDVAKSGPGFEGKQLSVRKLLGREFVVIRIVELDGQYGPYLGVQIEGKGKPFFFFTGHKVLYQKLLQCVGHEPLLATITEVAINGSDNTYFDIE